jgi:membrane-bound metal-dependent hydrolase YbcI (DUF457 family)
MPSVISHFAAGAGLALSFTGLNPVTRAVRPAGLVLSAGLLAVAPDLDTLFAGVIPYGHFYGHRGFFHSPCFALFLSIAAASLVFAVARQFTWAGWLTVSCAFCLAVASHGILDSMSSGGLGVMLLYPWSDRRLFLPWRPFPAPPIRIYGLSAELVARTLRAELPLVLGCLAAGTLARLSLRRWSRRESSPAETLPFSGRGTSS